MKMNKNLLSWNPEFAKNIWLEISVQRLIAMPVIIALIAILISTNYDTAFDAIKAINYGALMGFVFIGILWGIKSASNSILDEYNERTWDWQKMSITGAWKLVVGKLFGSTIYNWYGALICLFIYLYTSLQLGNFGKAITNAILLILSMISLHGVVILMALQLIRQADGRSKVKNNRILIGSLLFFAMLSNLLGFSIFNYTELDTNIQWYFLSISITSSYLMTSFFYCAWIIAGLYRSMRAELQYSDSPNWWFTFLFSNFLFQLGFLFGYESLSIKAIFLIASGFYFLQLLFLNYFLAFTEPKDIVNFKTLQNAWQQQQKGTFLKNAPLWMLTLPVSFLFGLILVILLAIIGKKEVIDDIERSIDFNVAEISIAFLLSTFCFILRDFGVMLIFDF